MIAFALGVELSTMGDHADIVGYASGAFANKGSKVGFYNMIGSRQSVFMRINNALYGRTDGNGPYNFAQYGGNFNPSQDETNYSIQARYGWSNNWGEKILMGSGFTREQLLAWEWGNPTTISPQPFMDALREDRGGTCDTCLLYLSDPLTDNMKPFYDDSSGLWIYGIEVVLTQNQMVQLCGNDSCVSPKK